MDKRKAESKRKMEAIRRVLSESDTPLGPTEIARRIGEPWCYTGVYLSSAAICSRLKKMPDIERRNDAPGQVLYRLAVNKR